MAHTWDGPAEGTPGTAARRRRLHRRSTVVALTATAALTAPAAVMFWPALAGGNAVAAASGPTGFASENGGTTGGRGGATVRATTGTQIHQALCSRAGKDTPIVIEVAGIITVGNTAKVSGPGCTTADGVIELKGISNVSLVGVGSSAVFDQVGIHIRGSRNIIIQNVTVRNVKKSGSPTSNGGDAIGMEGGVRNVWVDHVSLEASGGESAGFDGLFDMKNDTQYVTLSYSTLRNSGRGGLIGSSETDRSNGFITFHHNLYENLDSRTPLLRGGVAHAYNNYYLKLNESGINSRAGARAKVENNYFRQSKDVLGTFYTTATGTWQASGNILDQVTWSASASDYRPAGPGMTSTATVPIPYTYAMDPASCVPDVVAGTAGAGKGLAVSDGNCKPQSPAPTSTTTPVPTTTATTTPVPTTTTTAPVPTTTTTTATPTPGVPSGANLSLSGGADGSGKAGGTSYGDAIDGKTATYWSPSGSTGRISVKWGSAKTVGVVVIREASGGVGAIKNWRLTNNDTGAVLASGTGAGMISFTPTSLKKINFEITSSSGTPQVAEFETYASGTGSTGTTTPKPTTTPTATTAPPAPGAWPNPSRTEQLSAPRNISGSFDGGLVRFQGWGGGQSENQEPLFVLADGATLKNVVIGNLAGDGVHCLGTCSLVNVWWEDVGEDAATFMGTSASQTMTIDGGGARSATDKVFQHNGPGTFIIKNFQASDIGKLYRSCGNCSKSYKRDVVVDNVTVSGVKASVVGINSNFGDTATLTRVRVVGSSGTTICQRYKGVAKGSEPTKIGSGPDSTYCLYKPSDITYA
jgi:pectate lyase